MRRFRLPEQMPPWMRQSARAVIALVLGLIVGLSASEPELLIVVAVVLVTLFVTASLRRPDPLVFLAFMAIAMPKVYIPGSPIPLGEALMLLAAFSALLTLKEARNHVPGWAKIALGVLLAAYLVASLVNGLSDFTMWKRMIHMAVFALTIVGLTRGLLSWRIALRGVQVGLMTSVVVSLFMFPLSSYTGRLTGLFGDPNVAGLLIVVLGTVSLWGIKRRRYQVAYGSVLGLGLMLTFSRTAFLAALLVALWVWVGRRLRPIPALGVVLLVTVVLAVLPTSVQSIGPFGNRTGSDQLRDRVATQEFNLVKQKPIFGHGAGTATVMVNFGTTKFFFHNSYLALVEEAGTAGLAALVLLLFGSFLALVSLDTTDRQSLLEGGLIGVAVMGINLGEVLVELSAAVVIGYALAHLMAVRRRNASSAQLEAVP